MTINGFKTTLVNLPLARRISSSRCSALATALRAASVIWNISRRPVSAAAAGVMAMSVYSPTEPPAPGEFADHPPRLYFDSCPALARFLTGEGS